MWNVRYLYDICSTDLMFITIIIAHRSYISDIITVHGSYLLRGNNYDFDLCSSKSFETLNFILKSETVILK